MRARRQFLQSIVGTATWGPGRRVHHDPRARNLARDVRDVVLPGRQETRDSLRPNYIFWQYRPKSQPPGSHDWSDAREVIARHPALS
jgi:hypothetical protein